MSLEKIKLEAMNQFSEKGFDGTSIKNITSQIGITPPALYAHFRSKEDLFIYIMKECMRSFTNDVISAIKSQNESVHDKLYKVYSFYIDEIISLNPRALLILRNGMFPSEDLREKTIEIISNAHKEVGYIIKEILEEGIIRKLIKINSVEKYYRKFYKLITAQVYQVLAYKLTITEADKLEEWKDFWNQIKYE